MKEHTNFFEEERFFEDNRRQWKDEATAMPSLGILVTRKIAKQQAVRRKRQRYGLVAAAVCVLLAVGTAVFYTVSPVRTAVTHASVTLAQHSAEALTGIQQAVRRTIQPVWVQIQIAAQTIATVADTTKKIAAVVAGWPVQVWYVLFLIVGVGVLLAIDFLVRYRKNGAPDRIKRATLG